MRRLSYHHCLSPIRRQAIIWTNAGILLIRALGSDFSEISIGIQILSSKKLHFKTSSAKWRPFCLGLNELTNIIGLMIHGICKYVGLYNPWSSWHTSHTNIICTYNSIPTELDKLVMRNFIKSSPSWLVGLDLFNDDTCPSVHISLPTQVNVSQSCFNSLNILLKLNYIVQVWGLVEVNCVISDGRIPLLAGIPLCKSRKLSRRGYSMIQLCSIYHDIPVTLHTPGAYGQWSVFDHNGDK